MLEEFADSYVLVTTDRPTDRETSAQHQLTLTCTDSGLERALSSSVSVEISVVDIDDHPPRFTQAIYNCSVVENRQPLEVEPSYSMLTVLAAIFNEPWTLETDGQDQDRNCELFFRNPYVPALL